MFGVESGFAGSKFTVSRMYPPPPGKKKTIAQKNNKKYSKHIHHVLCHMDRKVFESKGTPSSSTCFLISIPSGLLEPISCKARI